MEPDAKIHNQAPGQTLGIQSKKGKREYMNKWDQDLGEEIYRDSWTKPVEAHELWMNSWGTSMVLNYALRM